MSAIGPGDWVEFTGKPDGYVNPDRGLAWGSGHYVLGALYVVAEVGRQCADGAGRAWPSLRTACQPVNRAGVLTSVPVAAFRPVYRPNAGLVEDLLRSIPAEAVQPQPDKVLAQ